MIKEYWNKLPWFLKNRYAITIALFAMWMAFFDHYNMISQVELRSELYRLESDREYYQEQIVEIEENLEELLSDDAKLEKFAREKYFMKRPDEDIFVFVSDEKE